MMTPERGSEGREENRCVVGVDFGTLSARAAVVRVVDGNILGEAVAEYEHGVMRKLPGAETELPPDWALQDPYDYLGALKRATGEALRAAEANVSSAGGAALKVAALGFDFTACTMLPVDRTLTPLCKKPEFSREPHAWVKLWKHRSAGSQAQTITAMAGRQGEEWLTRYGGTASAEWFFPKVLETLENAPEVYAGADRFLEAADWLTALLTGNEVNGPSFAGFKAGYIAGAGYPSEALLTALDPRLEGFAGAKLRGRVAGPASVAGKLTEKGAELTGLPAGTPLAVPVIDAHASMPALNLTKPGDAMLILGTSGCLIMHSDGAKDVPGTCGYMKDSVIPGLTTYEAGQPAVGDIFDWFVRTSLPADYLLEAHARGIGRHELLTEKAARLKPGQSGLVALDWLGGNRSVLADASLRGMICGLGLNTKPEEQYRAWLEATAFGFRRILDQYEMYGVDVDNICVSGGIALKNPLLMQIYADVTGRRLSVSGAKQSGALGSAIMAAAAAGCYPSVTAAAASMSAPYDRVYTPDPAGSEAYAPLYRKYCRLHDIFKDL